MAKSTGFYNGKHFEWDFDDVAGELRIKCVHCGKIDTLTGDKAQKFNNMTSAQTYLCYSCWLKNKDAEKQELQYEKEDRISYAQSFNLAVNMLSDKEKEEDDTASAETKIKMWQKWFYEKLTERK